MLIYLNLYYFNILDKFLKIRSISSWEIIKLFFKEEQSILLSFFGF